MSESLALQENVSLARYTTLGVGGEARFLVEVDSIEELQAACQFALEQTGQSPVVLGAGSNVLIKDGPLERLVIVVSLLGIEKICEDNDSVQFKVAAGENWDNFVSFTTDKGLSGIENLSGIPGKTGATPVQNINAYGASVADSIVEVSAYNTKTGDDVLLSRDECLFAYRDSIFKKLEGQDLIITYVTFRLEKNPTGLLAYKSSSQSIKRILEESGVTEPGSSDIRNAVLTAREKIGMLPNQFRSAGSFFKNTIVTNEQFSQIENIVKNKFKNQDKKFSPWYWKVSDENVKISTAFLLECSPYNKETYGDKRIDGVGLSPKHSLSIVTEENATSTAVKGFSEKIIDSIENIFSVTLEKEVIEV